MTNSLIDRLRDDEQWYSDENVPCPVDEAADMLEFFFSRLQADNLKMGGGYNYRFRSGWPMQYCVGKDPLEAVRNAVAELKREQARADHMLDQKDRP